MLTIKKLKEIIKDLPDDLPVVSDGGYDHAYNAFSNGKMQSAGVSEETKCGPDYSEWISEEDNIGERKVEVFVLW